MGGMPICTVGALVFNADKRVLMVRTQKWSDFVGDSRRQNQIWRTFRSTPLKREIKEETNLDIGDIVFVMAQDCIHSKEFYRRRAFRAAQLHLPRAGPVEVRLNEEAQEFRWVTAARRWSCR